MSLSAMNTKIIKPGFLSVSFNTEGRVKRSKALIIYLTGTMLQIWLICLAVFILRRNGFTVDYTNLPGLLAIAVGGTSSALWGIIISIKYKNRSIKKIITDFFNIMQSCKSYILAFAFIALDFSLLFIGSLSISAWYIPIVLFIKAMLFGGIEEIGWRYTFQPVLQEGLNYLISTLITFAAWLIWHLSYFYIEGTLPAIQIIPFSIGLLVNSFILSALYNRTESLWICVMTHSLINVFSQIGVEGNVKVYFSYIIKVIIIVLAVFISKKCKDEEKRKIQ